MSTSDTSIDTAIFDSIVEVLGGVNATARVIGRTPSQVCHWRNRDGRFPAEVFFVLREAVAAQGFRLPPTACRFDDADRFDDDHDAEACEQ